MNRHLFSLVAALAAGLFAAEAVAGGILVARFGGEHGHPTTDNPTAMYYNPAGLALGFGTRLYLDGNLAWRSFTFTRDPAGIDNAAPEGTLGGYTPEGAGVAANSGEAKLFNLLASPFFAVTSDFGVKGFGAGVGFYVPFGGQSTWDSTEASADFPGAQDGPQRWWVIEGTIRSLYITGAAAYEIPKLNLSLGLGVNYVISEVNTIRARNPQGTDHLVTGGPNGDVLQEGRTLVDVNSKDISLGVGLIWRPADDWWVGVSYQSQPGFGDNTLEGDAIVISGSAPVEDGSRTPVTLSQAMPDVLRAGVRWRPDPMQEIRLFGSFQRWSVLEEQCILNTDVPGHSCETGKGSIGIIPRYWEDGFDVRVGYSYWLDEGIEVFGGAGYDKSVVPDTTLEPSLFDADKATVSVGGRFELLEKSLAIGAAYTQVFYFPPETSARGGGGADASGNPASNLDGTGIRAEARSPDAAGTYEHAVGVFNLNVQYTF